MSQPNIPPRLIRRYMNYMIVAALIWCFFGAVVSGPLQAGLLLSLQLSKAQIGFVMSLSLLFLPMQMIGALLQQRFFHRKRFWFWCILVHYSSFLGIALLPCRSVPHREKPENGGTETSRKNAYGIL